MNFKVGDIVKTKCFGPKGSVGEVGLIIKPANTRLNAWEVLFRGSAIMRIAGCGLEVVSASR